MMLPPVPPGQSARLEAAAREEVVVEREEVVERPARAERGPVRQLDRSAELAAGDLRILRRGVLVDHVDAAVREQEHRTRAARDAQVRALGIDVVVEQQVVDGEQLPDERVLHLAAVDPEIAVLDAGQLALRERGQRRVGEIEPELVLVEVVAAAERLVRAARIGAAGREPERDRRRGSRLRRSRRGARGSGRGSGPGGARPPMSCRRPGRSRTSRSARADRRTRRSDRSSCASPAPCSPWPRAPRALRRRSIPSRAGCSRSRTASALPSSSPRPGRESRSPRRTRTSRAAVRNERTDPVHEWSPRMVVVGASGDPKSPNAIRAHQRNRDFL